VRDIAEERQMPIDKVQAGIAALGPPTPSGSRGPHAPDRLVRVLYTLHAVRAQRAVDPAKFVQTFLATFEKIVPTKHPRPLALEIPAPRRALEAESLPAVR
jgi:hypothetical protein